MPHPTETPVGEVGLLLHLVCRALAVELRAVQRRVSSDGLFGALR
jgi:hypothetical protein